MVGTRFARWARVAGVVLLLGLTVDNVRLGIEHQLGSQHCENHACVSPRSVTRKAELSHNRGIRMKLAVFYFLADHLAGVDLRVPPVWSHYVWDLERIGRVQAHVAASALQLDKAHDLCLRRHASSRRTWARGAKRTVLVYFTVDRSARDYVVAQSRWALHVLPRKVFEAGCRP